MEIVKKIQTIKLEEYGYQKKVHLSQEDKERLIEATLQSIRRNGKKKVTIEQKVEFNILPPIANN